MKLYIAAAIIGTFFENIAVTYCIQQRGCIFFGGEYLVIPAFVLAAAIINGINGINDINRINDINGINDINDLIMEEKDDVQK